MCVCVRGEGWHVQKTKATGALLPAPVRGSVCVFGDVFINWLVKGDDILDCP